MKEWLKNEEIKPVLMGFSVFSKTHLNLFFNGTAEQMISEAGRK